MKTVISILLIFLTTTISGRTNNSIPDSLKVIKLPYTILDSSAIEGITGPSYVNGYCVHSCKDYAYFLHGGGITYRTSDRNRWTSIYFPTLIDSFFSIDNAVTDVKFINLDKKGQPEIIIYGDIARWIPQIDDSLAMKRNKVMLIINIDSVPTLLFNVYYGWTDETKTSYKQYERKIEIKGNVIIISKQESNPCPFTKCKLTQIPSGSYIMKSGQIIKK
jgi:hypothetical protein